VYNNNALNGTTTLQRIVDFFDGCQAPAQDSVHVQSIQLRLVAQSGGRYTVQSTLRILDQNGQIVPAAAVSSIWTLPNGNTRAQTVNTNAQGVARFRVTTLQTGVYQFCVADVVKAGFVYDPSQNGETCDTITVP
jgi:hypothetical protein